MRQTKRGDSGLAELWLFADCTPAQLKRIADLGTRLTVIKGRRLVEVGTRVPRFSSS